MNRTKNILGGKIKDNELFFAQKRIDCNKYKEIKFIQSYCQKIQKVYKYNDISEIFIYEREIFIGTIVKNT